MHAATLLQPLKTTLRVGPLYYDRGQQVAHSAGLWDAESIIFNRGRSVARRGLSTGRVFHPATVSSRDPSTRPLDG